jgi:hypothetical protein
MHRVEPNQAAAELRLESIDPTAHENKFLGQSGSIRTLKLVIVERLDSQGQKRSSTPRAVSGIRRCRVRRSRRQRRRNHHSIV